jgi:ssRNA-specific RNase YbeY (16S rRNA maturation enzyme)
LLRSEKEDIQLLKMRFMNKNTSNAKTVSSLVNDNKRMNKLNVKYRKKIKKYQYKILSLEMDIKDIEDMLSR